MSKYSVGDKLQLRIAAVGCRCGCQDIHVIKHITDGYVVVNERTGTPETYPEHDIDLFFHLVAKRKDRKKTGFGRFICQIES